MDYYATSGLYPELVRLARVDKDSTVRTVNFKSNIKQFVLTVKLNDAQYMIYIFAEKYEKRKKRTVVYYTTVHEHHKVAILVYNQLKKRV